MKLPPVTPGRPNRVYPPATPSLHGLASVVTSVIVVCGLYFGRAVLIPITLSILLSFLLAPLVNALRRLHLGQPLSIFIAVLFALTTLLGAAALITTQLVQLAADLPQYRVAIQAKVETVEEKTIGRADLLLSRAATTLQRVAPSKPSLPRLAGREGRANPAPTPVEVHQPALTPLQLAQRAFSPVVGPLETSFIVIVVTIFILLQRDDLRDRLISLFGSRDLHRTTTAINDAAGRLSRYFVAQLAVNLGVGAVLAIGMAGIGLPGALLFGLVAALLRFVPYIGIWIAALPAVCLGAAIQPQWTMAVWTLILFVVVDVVAGQFAEPVVYGRRSGLSPLAVVIAAIFWSWLWGPIGLVLSTPLTLCVVTLGRYADRLHFLTVLLGDQPALSAAQTLYQRLLADDPHEALVQAERLLGEMSLLDYYDHVALEGLRLARNDALRGVLTVEQLARVDEAVTDIVEHLETVEGVPEAGPLVQPPLAPLDGAPDPAAPANAAGSAASPASPAAAAARREAVARGPAAHAAGPAPAGSILCISGRGAFDAVALAIAVQLLGRQGFATVSIPYETLRERGSEAVRGMNPAVICVVSLDAGESPPYLRNLLRRISATRPDATLLVGFTGSPGEPAAVTADAAAGTRQAGDVRYLATLRELIEACAVPGAPAGARGGPATLLREAG